jgi:excisionase family DNA binding protein
MQRYDGVLTVGIVEAARLLSLSSRTVATLVSSGELSSLKVGRRRIILVSELHAFVKRDHRVHMKTAQSKNK